MLLRRIVELKEEEVTGRWRKVHNEDFNICTLHQILG
jgi:hypothetical protein